MRPNMRKKWIFIVPAAIVGIVLFITIGGEAVKLLWNWVLPPLFGWHQVTFWQALALLALCRILFGGLGRHGMGRMDARRRIRERLDQMTPEERERLREGWRARCGFGPGGSEAGPQ